MGSAAGVPAGEVPLQIRGCFFQHAVVLRRHFPRPGVPAAPTDRDGFIVLRAGAAQSLPAGEVKLKSVRNLPELHRAGAAAEGSHPPPSQEMILL